MDQPPIPPPTAPAAIRKASPHVLRPSGHRRPRTPPAPVHRRPARRGGARPASSSASSTPPAAVSAPQRAVATVLPPIAQMGPSPQDPSRASTVVTARFRPAMPGRPVSLERRRDGSWDVVERSRLDPAGRASFTAPSSSGGPATYRVTRRGVPRPRGEVDQAGRLRRPGAHRRSSTPSTARRSGPRGSTGSSSTTRGAAGPAPRATPRRSRSVAAPCSSACWPIPPARPRPARRTTRRATTSATTAGGSTGTSPPSTASTSSTASRPPGCGSSASRASTRRSGSSRADCWRPARRRGAPRST